MPMTIITDLTETRDWVLELQLDDLRELLTERNSISDRPVILKAIRQVSARLKEVQEALSDTFTDDLI
jgi:hypothetical protein